MVNKFDRVLLYKHDITLTGITFVPGFNNIDLGEILIKSGYSLLGGVISYGSTAAIRNSIIPLNPTANGARFGFYNTDSVTITGDITVRVFYDPYISHDI